MFYTLANAKDDFKNDWLDGFLIYKEGYKENGGHDGWSIEVFQGKDPDSRIRRKIFTARKELKIYKTLDAALKAVSEIGFTTKILTGVY